MNKVQKLQSWGLALWLAAALAAGTAPSYNGQWIGSVVCFIIGAVLLAYSKVLDGPRA